MKVVGIKHSPFTTKDGKDIDGYNIYATSPIPKDRGDGFTCDRLYLSADKLSRCGYKPKLGDEISVMYNRFGKPETIEAV